MQKGYINEQDSEGYPVENQIEEYDLKEEIISEEMTAKDLTQRLRLKKDSLSSLVAETAWVLPDNSAIEDPAQESLYFHEDAKELMHVLRTAKISAQLYDDGRPKKSIDFRSADIILPKLIFAGQKVMEGGLAALGAWIVKRWLQNPKSKPPTIKAQYILFENGAVKKWASITGPAKKVAEFLRGSDAGNDGKNPPRKRIGR